MSMRIFGTFALVAVLTGAMTACSQSGQQSPAAREVVASTATAPAGPATATLTIQLATVDGCEPNQPIVATLSWYSSVTHVKVMITGPRQTALRLFSESGYAGSAKIAEWVVADTRFSLIDTSTGATLANRVMSAAGCSAGGG